MRVLMSSNGSAVIVDMPEPEVKDHYVKVQVTHSAVSIGTELLMIRTNPKASLGYSAAGVVLEVGEGVTHVKPGDRVACYGTPAHRDIMISPKYLTAPIPDGVTSQEAAFSGIGAIAIHALRQAELTFGESVIIVGVGILGQIIAAIAHASNYRVIGYEPMEERRNKLLDAGISYACSNEEELKNAIANATTNGKGADAVLICASTRKDNLIDTALPWLRDRGKVVIVGDTGGEFNRDLLFGKEASITISRAGGPGRYEADYEQRGFDYPIGYVRWTEGRNVQDFLRMLQEKRIDLKSLTTDEVAFQDLPNLYGRYEREPSKMLGVVVSFE